MDESLHFRGSSVRWWQVRKHCRLAVCASLPLYFPGETSGEGSALPGVKQAQWSSHTSGVPVRTGPWACHYVCVTSLACTCRTHLEICKEDLCLFFFLYHSLFSYSVANTVYLVLLTSIWLPIPSHKARWNYNPRLHGLDVGTRLSYASYLCFDKMRIFEHCKTVITF